MRNVWDEFTSKMKKNRIEYRTDLGFDRLTTLGVGGKIKITVYPDSIGKLKKVVRLCKKSRLPLLVLGRGSNVLASDEPYVGVVVVTTKLCRFTIRKTRVTAQCGANSCVMGWEIAQHGLSGGEFLACLPGTIGGAVVGNAGCFGQDVKGVVRYVVALKNGRVRRVKSEKCLFCKRDSVFKHSDWVVLGVKLRLNKSDPESAKAKINEMRRIKAATQPLNKRSAGCALYHEGVAVSKLIDEMGLKGYRIGGAEVSKKHAGFVLNIDKATALDIYLIIQYLRQSLWNKYGICAKTEIKLVNFTEEQNDIFPNCEK